MGSLGHTELLSLVPRLLDFREVIQVAVMDDPALQDQLEKLIWNKGWGGERSRGCCGCPRAGLPGLSRDWPLRVTSPCNACRPVLQGQGLGGCPLSPLSNTPGSYSPRHLAPSLRRSSDSFSTQTTLSFRTPAFWLDSPVSQLIAIT